MINKRILPHVITVVSFVVFIVLGLACTTTPRSRKWEGVNLNGEDSKLLEGTAWIRTGIDNPYKVEFHPNGKFNSAIRGNASWERVGMDVKLVLFDGFYYFEGKYDPDNLIISGVCYNSISDGKEIFILEPAGFIGNQRYVDGFDTALYGRWYTLDDNAVVMRTTGNSVTGDVVVGYAFFAGNFVTFKRYGVGGDIEKLEKGTYTTDDKGTLTFTVTHYYDRSEKIFLSKDEFRTRYKAQDKTVAQTDEAIKEYFPDRSVKYFINDASGGSAFLGWTKVLEFRESIPRLNQFFK